MPESLPVTREDVLEAWNWLFEDDATPGRARLQPRDDVDAAVLVHIQKVLENDRRRVSERRA